LVTSPLKGKDAADTASKAIQQAIEDTGLYDSYKEASAAIKDVSEFGTRYKEWKQKQRDIGEASSSAMASEADDSVTKGSMIAKMYAKMAAKASESFEPKYKERAELVRAFIGDYKVKPVIDASGFTAGEDAVTYIPPCSKNSAGYEAFLDGTVQYEKIDDDKCNGVSDTNKDMRQKTIQMVDSIITKLKDKTTGALTTEEQNFLDDFPQPVYTILKQTVAMGLADTEKPVLGEYIAKLRAYYLYRDLLSDGYAALDNYHSLLTGAAFDPVAKQGHLESIEKQQGKIRELHRVNSDAINKEIQQFQNTMFATLEKLRDINVVIGDMYKTTGKRKK
jgi:hypothetical protein